MATQPMATVARIDPATWKPDRKAVNAPTWAWDNNAFAWWFWLEEKITNPKFDANKYSNTYDIAGQKYGILKAQLPPATPNLDVSQGTTTIIPWTQPNPVTDLNQLNAGASATQQEMYNVIGRQREDEQRKAEEYRLQRESALKSSESALYTSKIDASYNEYKVQQDERNKAYNSNQTELAQINAQMQRDLISIGNSPTLWAISRGQAILKQQQYAPRVTMLQANTALLQDNINSAQNEWNIYYQKENDNRTALVNHYDKVMEMADNGYITLTNADKETMKAQVGLLNDISTRELEQKDKLLSLMEKNPIGFAKAKILPTDTYEQALAKMVKTWTLTADSDMTLVKQAMLKYIDAGILPTDNFETVARKVKNSTIYQKETQTADKWTLQDDWQGGKVKFNAGTGQIIKLWDNQTDTSNIWSLSKKYEASGWPWVIWYDSTGWYSYGSYQLAHNNAQKFIEQSSYASDFEWLKFNSKEWQNKWKEIAKNDPVGFEEEQRKFIEWTHYLPQLELLQKQGIDTTNFSDAMQNVIWSTAVQHWANTNIIASSYNQIKNETWAEPTEAALIERIYKNRWANGANFVSSTDAVKASVKNRFEREKNDALEMLASWFETKVDLDELGKIIVASSSMTEKQENSFLSGLKTSKNPMPIILNKAKSLLPTAEAKNNLLNSETTLKTFWNLNNLLTSYHKNGGDTDLLSGSFEEVTRKLGNTTNPKLIPIATSIEQTIQTYRKAISGTAYSDQEGRDITSIFPNVKNSKEVNDAIIAQRIQDVKNVIGDTYSLVLGDEAYKQVDPNWKPLSERTNDVTNSSINVSPTNNTNIANSQPNNQSLLSAVQSRPSIFSSIWSWVTWK